MSTETNKIEADVSDELKKPFWTNFFSAVRSPYDYITHITSKNPLFTILAVVFLLQPVISTSIDVIHTWKQIANPNARPISKAEFDLLNQKVSLMQGIIIAHVNEDAALRKSPSEEVKPLVDTQNKLDNLGKKLDDAYIKNPPKTK